MRRIVENKTVGISVGSGVGRKDGIYFKYKKLCG